MKRYSSANTFSQGLVSDLNPLTTPNNVLTNALNATLISFNGNEYVLQNDMGNGRVESAYLPSGYVPIGIQEYGGVIYVVSYNPLTNKGQVGSFPSPERNITSEEAGKSNLSLSLDDFKGQQTRVIRLKIFGEEATLRAGDKFTILMDGGDSSFLSNFKNVDNDTVKYLKNKALTLRAEVLDKNNNLFDITSSLKRIDQTTGKVIPEYNGSTILSGDTIFNTEYFTTNGVIPDNPQDTDLDTYRDIEAVNIFNSKLVGNLVIVAEYNTVNTFGVALDGEKIGDNYKLYLQTDWTYNCPDGLNGEPSNIYHSEIDPNLRTIKGYKYVFYKVGDSPSNYTELPLGASSVLYGQTKFTEEQDQTVTNYDEASKQYNTSQVDAITLNNLNFEQGKPRIINYEVIPTDYRLNLDGLKCKGSINLDKLGTGEIRLNIWKYYKNNEYIQLQYGFEAYPRRGEVFQNLRFEFYDVYDQNKLVYTKQIDNKRNYNGRFTTVLNDSKLLTVDQALPNNRLYLVKIKISSNKAPTGETATIADTKLYDIDLGTRWLFNTKLYNDAYIDETLANLSWTDSDGITYYGDDWGTDVAEWGTNGMSSSNGWIENKDSNLEAHKNNGAGLHYYRFISVDITNNGTYSKEAQGTTNIVDTLLNDNEHYAYRTTQLFINSTYDFQINLNNQELYPFIPQFKTDFKVNPEIAIYADNTSITGEDSTYIVKPSILNYNPSSIEPLKTDYKFETSTGSQSLANLTKTQTTQSGRLEIPLSILAKMHYFTKDDPNGKINNVFTPIFELTTTYLGSLSASFPQQQYYIVADANGRTGNDDDHWIRMVRADTNLGTELVDTFTDSDRVVYNEKAKDGLVQYGTQAKKPQNQVMGGYKFIRLSLSQVLDKVSGDYPVYLIGSSWNCSPRWGTFFNNYEQFMQDYPFKYWSSALYKTISGNYRMLNFIFTSKAVSTFDANINNEVLHLPIYTLNGLLSNIYKYNSAYSGVAMTVPIIDSNRYGFNSDYTCTIKINYRTQSNITSFMGEYENISNKVDFYYTNSDEVKDVITEVSQKITGMQDYYEAKTTPTVEYGYKRAGEEKYVPLTGEFNKTASYKLVGDTLYPENNIGNYFVQQDGIFVLKDTTIYIPYEYEGSISNNQNRQSVDSLTQFTFFNNAISVFPTSQMINELGLITQSPFADLKQF